MSSPLGSTDPLAGLWQEILAYGDCRERLFGGFTRELLDRHPEDRLPHPGFVGKRYARGGLLFLALNPAAGKDGHATDEMPHYSLLGELKAAGPANLRNAFEKLMDYDSRWYPSIPIFRTMVVPCLSMNGLTLESIAYLNILKWRTVGDKHFMPLCEISLRAHTLEQIRLLDPSIIAILGFKSRDILADHSEFQQQFGNRCIAIPRSNGDKYVTPAGQLALAELSKRIRSNPPNQAKETAKPILVRKA